MTKIINQDDAGWTAGKHIIYFYQRNTGFRNTKRPAMNKLIAAFDGLKYSTATRDLAIDLAQKNQMHLVGVFLDDETYKSYRIYELISREGVSEMRLKELEQHDKQNRKASADDFRKQGNNAGIPYSVHHDHQIAIHQLKHESIYADLLLIDSKETFTHYEESKPTRFIRELLADTQCPVLLVQGNSTPIKKVVLLYDGGPSSVYAIRQFSYLLPGYMKLPATVLTVTPPDKSLHMPDNRLMKELMKRHWPDAGYEVHHGLAEEEIIRQLAREDEGTLVVLGAYRRGNISRWFRESMADLLMRETRLPLFVAHN